ncbi:MAG: transposase [Patescibacteria group bacterium]
MRKEPFGLNDYVHVYNRGNRKQPIVIDNKDRYRFLQYLYYFNTEVTPPNPFRGLLKSDFYSWPDEWPPRKPIVKILCFILLNNHFHLLLQEIVNGGITLFMRKLGTGMTNYFNTKYQESGRLFQGAYKARTVNNDEYLKYLSVYIQVKNLFEIYPKGFKKALQEFDKAFDWAVQYPFSSLSVYNLNKANNTSSIITKDILSEIFPNTHGYKEFSKDCIVDIENRLKDLI